MASSLASDRYASARAAAPAESSIGASIDQRLWYGRVPVVFSLHPSEVTTLHAPRPFYVRLFVFFGSACVLRYGFIISC